MSEIGEPWLPEKKETEITPEEADRILEESKPSVHTYSGPADISKSTPEYSEIIHEHEHVEHHYTMKDAERMSGGLDCRLMQPTSFRPDCSFLTCQIGKCFSSKWTGETLFELVAFGDTWNKALHMLGRIVR